MNDGKIPLRLMLRVGVIGFDLPEVHVPQCSPLRRVEVGRSRL